MPEKTITNILTAKQIEREINKITFEILEENNGTQDLVLIGIRTGGVYLAQRLADKIEQNEGDIPPMGVIDITLYRDDVGTGFPNPVVGKTEIDFDIRDKVVILVDDVIFTGRTVRAALSGLIDYGRARAIKLAVMIDRGHRELPIEPTYIGRKVVTQKEEMVEVYLTPEAEKDQVVVISTK